MAVNRKSDRHPGDIRCVLASSHISSNRKKNWNINEVHINPDTITVGDVKYYLTKCETVTFTSQNYTARMKEAQYCIGHTILPLCNKLLLTVVCG
jgi:hypothetical protein